MMVVRPPWSKEKILFTLICVLCCFLYIDILLAFNLKSEKTALLVSRIDHAFIVYLFPLYIHFFHVYLNVSGQKWLIKGAYAMAFVLMCLTPTPLYIQSMHQYRYGFFAKGGPVYPLFGVFGFLATVYALVLVFQAIGKERNHFRKTGYKFVAAGFGMMGILNAFSILPNLGVPIYPPGNFSFLPLTVFYIGLFSHDLLDMGRLIRKGLVYSLLTALLTGVYALITAILGRYLDDRLSGGGNLYLQMVYFLLVAAVFGPLNTGIHKLIDQMFFKGKYDYRRTLKTVSRIITTFRDLNEISDRLMDTLMCAMKLKNCAVFLPAPGRAEFQEYARRGSGLHCRGGMIRKEDSALLRFLLSNPQPVLKSRLLREPDPEIRQEIISGMDDLCAAAILPLSSLGKISGLIVLGEMRSRGVFSKEDADLLETLANQVSLAVENAHSYKAVQAVNENLEHTVTVRTAALQQALEEKEKTQEQLVRSESLAAIGQLVAGTAHELNNPIASATSLIQTVLEDLEQMDRQALPDADLIEDLRFADRELGRAKAIVESLLSLSRQTQTYTEAVDLNTVAEDALRILHNKYKHSGFVIVKELTSDLPVLQGNFANLGQVLLNIFQNAIDAVDEQQGEIILHTGYDGPSRSVTLSCRDNGPGIPEKIRKDIFKPFFTTKPVGRGTGLGLYICHEIVERHGGTLYLEKECEIGTEFTVRLPIPPSNGS